MGTAAIPFFVLVGLFWLAVIVPTIAVGVRRLHDAGYSGWFWLLNLIPSIGSIIVLVLCVMQTSPQAPKYGPPVPRGWTPGLRVGTSNPAIRPRGTRNRGTRSRGTRSRVTSSRGTRSRVTTRRITRSRGTSSSRVVTARSHRCRVVTVRSHRCRVVTARRHRCRLAPPPPQSQGGYPGSEDQSGSAGIRPGADSSNDGTEGQREFHGR